GGRAGGGDLGGSGLRLRPLALHRCRGEGEEGPGQRLRPTPVGEAIRRGVNPCRGSVVLAHLLAKLRSCVQRARVWHTRGKQGRRPLIFSPGVSTYRRKRWAAFRADKLPL